MVDGAVKICERLSCQKREAVESVDLGSSGRGMFSTLRAKTKSVVLTQKGLDKPKALFEGIFGIKRDEKGIISKDVPEFCPRNSEVQYSRDVYSGSTWHSFSISYTT